MQLSSQPPQLTTAPATDESTVLYWFRQDLRLSDNPALTAACQHCEKDGSTLALVVCLPDDEDSGWGFSRMGQHRKSYLADTVRDLAARCGQLGNRLLIVCGDPASQLPALMQTLSSTALYCEEIAAPEEIRQLKLIRQQAILMNGFQIFSQWQSSLLAPEQLPFDIANLPLVFTSFRTKVEKAGCRPKQPLPPLSTLPQMPARAHLVDIVNLEQWAGLAQPDPRSAVPYQQLARGGETAAQQHLSRYFQSELPRTYKETRNGLIGFEYSTKFSPWLASGALSARQIYQQLVAHEAAHGQNESTYWIWFELLWRDYFRFLHMRFGRQLYVAQGLKHPPYPKQPNHHPERFLRWCQGITGESMIDAGMRELAASGYLSNRMRQIVASYLVNDLDCDWRAGAAWFETQLIDYDVYSNQGNWLYLAGVGTDPRANRRFNLQKQQQTYDPNQEYIKLWLPNTEHR